MSVQVVDNGHRQVSRSIEVDAPATEVFALVADPRRHHEFDGSGTVGSNIDAPAELVAGARFSTKMRMAGVPYRITSTVTALNPGRLVEWRHPFGHHWRWEIEEIAPGRSRVTETFDYRNTGALKDRFDYYERTGFAKRNAAGIEESLRRLHDRFSG